MKLCFERKTYCQELGRELDGNQLTALLELVEVAPVVCCLGFIVYVPC